MKARKLLRTIPMKLYALLLIVVLFSFFSNDFGLVDIQKTAIILAAGIDKSEEGFMLTAQIAVPKGTDRSQGGTSSVDVTTTGVTVSDCVSSIFGETGWVPKLVFCDLIVLGEEAASEDVIGYLNYFLRSEYMNDSCKLAVCEGKAEALIASKSALADVSSIAILNLFSDAAAKSGKVLAKTLKDFAVDYYGVSKSSYLPYIRMMEQRGSSQTGNGGSGSSDAGGEEGEIRPEVVYSAETTALFADGKMAAVLPPDETFAYSLLKGNVESGIFTAQDGEKPVTLSVLSNSGSIALDMKGAPKVKLKIGVIARLCCRGTTAPMEDVSNDNVPEAVLENAEELLKENTRKLWQTAKESGCDLFELKKALYRSSPKKYDEWKEFLLDKAEPEIVTDVRSSK